MSYKFKGTDIANITYTTGGISNAVGNTYKGFPPTVSTNFNMSKPLNLGYTVGINKVDVSNSCTASYIDVTSNTTTDVANNVSIPTGVKKLRYILIGGGCSGGGFGGNASATYNVSDKTAKGKGGNGGDGDYADLVVSNADIPCEGKNIQVIIGIGGFAANNGASKETDARLGQERSTTGDPGNPGNPGKSTNITIGGTNVSAPGGTAAAYGNGGYARADGAGGSTGTSSTPGNSNGGIDATNGPFVTDITKTPQTIIPINLSHTTPTNCPPIIGNYGFGGKGGINNDKTDNPNVNATAGSNGFCRIIWLYD